MSLNARLERDLAKGKIHFVNVEGSNISTESEEGYIENVEILGNTWQDSENLADIRSVGTKVEGQELYEIPVLSRGKNLAKFKESTGTSKGITFTCKDNTIYINGTNTGYVGHDIINGVTSDKLEGHHITSNVIDYYSKVKPYINRGGTFLLKMDGVNAHTNDGISYSVNVVYDDNKHIVRTDLQFGSVGVIKAEKCINGIFIGCWYSGRKFDVQATVQLEEGTQATPYEPYQEDKLTIVSPTPLEKVGDIADRIICKDGVWGVEKNIGNIMLDGSVLPKLAIQHNNRADLCYVEFNAFDNEMVSNSNTVFADGFIDMEAFNRNSPADKICAYSSCATYTSQKLRFLIPISDLSSVNPNGVAEFFKNNPTVVRYQATQSIFIPLPHNQQIKLRTFANKTNISFLTEIEPTLKAQVPKSLGATVNTHTSQIDNLNKELDRVKKLEESTVSTVTSDKAFTTIAETNGGYFEDVKIEGKTLVNRFVSRGITDTGSVIVNSNSNTTLTGTFTVILNDMSKKCNLDIVSISSGGWIRSVSSDNINKGILVTLKEDEYIGSIFGRYNDGWTSSDSDNFLKALILEGDHTDKDISFFEGLKSVGQDTDEIEILSQNKNLFSHIVAKANTTTSSDGQSVDLKFDVENKDTYFLVKTNKPLITGGSYTISFDVSGLGDNDSLELCVLKQGINIINIQNGRCSKSFKFEEYYGNGDSGFFLDDITKLCNSRVVLSNFQLEEGSSVSPYVPHFSNKKEILYYNPITQAWEKPVLREWDSIEKHSDGKYYYHKSSGEVVLNGSENWQKSSTSYANTVAFYVPVKGYDGQDGETLLICDRLKFSRYTLDEQGISANAGNRDIIRIKLNKNVLDDESVMSCKAWLQANPTTVVYPLAQEEVYECTNLDLITYSGETNLIVNSGAIQPRITLKVLSNVSNVVKLLQEKVSVLENKFINGLKQVLAGDMMSLAHLLYPEDFENNHEIQTLEL